MGRKIKRKTSTVEEVLRKEVEGLTRPMGRKRKGFHKTLTDEHTDRGVKSVLCSPPVLGIDPRLVFHPRITQRVAT